MEKDIEILEEILNRQIEDIEGTKIVYKAIENLINRVKELEEHHKQFYNGELLTAKQGRFIEDNYIPKSKIKEKMEEISGMAEVGDIEREIYNRAEYAIEILQELLEEQEDK